MRRMPVVRGTAAVMAFLTLTTVSASTLMFTYSGAINKALNINTSKIVETDDASAVNTAYYDSEFGTDYTNKQAALKVEMEVAAENVTQAEEGTVLLRNENAALPLDSASRVTIFGNGAAHSAMGGSTTSSVASIRTIILLTYLPSCTRCNPMAASRMRPALPPPMRATSWLRRLISRWTKTAVTALPA